MGDYTAVEINKPEICATTWMNLQTQCWMKKVRQKRKQNYCIYIKFLNQQNESIFFRGIHTGNKI